MKQSRMLFQFLLILIAGTQLVLSAQTTGLLTGRVTDPSGAIVPSASVESRNTLTELVVEATVGADGSYLVPALPAGIYRVTVSSEGFQTVTRTRIEVRVGQNVRLDFTLEIGALTEQIEVAADAVAVDTRSTTLGASVDNRRLVGLPLNGRNVMALANLIPGVGLANFPNTVTFSRQGPSVSVSGGRANENNVMLDGTTFATSLYKTAQNLPSPDSLEEFRVLTNTYSAEYGRAAGGVFIAVTKSGTNEFHGSAWEFFRNDALNATNYFTPSKPTLRQNQFGANIGGPIIRNKTFVFGSYQGLRIRQQRLNAHFPLTKQERVGDFSATSNPINDPTTGSPFTDNIIPSTRLDLFAANVLDRYVELPNNPDGRSVNLWSLPTESNQFSIKLDHNFSSADRLSFRTYRNKDSAANIGGGDTIKLAATSASTVQSWTIGETRIFSPAVVNELRGSYTRVESRRAASPLNETPRSLGAAYDQDGAVTQAPGISVSGRFNMAVPFDHFEPDDVMQLDDKVTWVVGKHALKFGGMVMRNRVLTQAQWQTSGIFGVDGSFTDFAASDFVLGAATSFVQRNVYDTDLHNYQYHFFVQDDWKIASRFTMNLGLRYELNMPYTEKFDRSAVIRPGTQSEIFPQAAPGLLYVGDTGVNRRLFDVDGNNFAPRIGLVWDVFGDGRTAIRSAYGVFYVPEGAILRQRQVENPPFQAALSFAPDSLSDPWGDRTSPFPWQGGANNPIFQYPFQGLTIFSDFRDAYVQQFNMGIQQQVASDLIVEVGYVGRVSHRLSSMRELNAAIYGPGATLANAQERRPILPEYYGSISGNFSEANANYHALQVRVEKRYAKSYTAGLAYTWSKSIDERSNISVDGGTIQDPNNYRSGERGLSDFDQRHLLRLNLVWDLPKLAGNHNPLVRGAIGGWRASGIFSFSSGTPFSVVSGRDTALAGPSRSLGPGRPNVVGSGVISGDRSREDKIAEYFNTDAFALPVIGSFGDSGRNLLVGPPDVRMDMAVMKRFGLGSERLGAFEFRAELFNLFNQVNLNQPTNAISSPAFGKVLGAGDARVIQLGLRYDF